MGPRSHSPALRAFRDYLRLHNLLVNAMNRNLIALLLMLSASAVALAQTPTDESALPKNKSQANEQWSEDGLQKLKVDGMDVVYMRPDASLAGYKKVSLGAVTVSFRKDWERSARVGVHSRLRPEDAQRIRDRLATVVREEVVKQLTEGGYQLVDTAAEDVLAVTASITDLYVTAPDVKNAANTQVYAVSAGEMTLIAELRDSLTGDIIVRAYDHAAARESIRPHLIWHTENETEARTVAKAWAKVLREQLDAANKASPAAQ